MASEESAFSSGQVGTGWRCIFLFVDSLDALTCRCQQSSAGIPDPCKPEGGDVADTGL